MNEAKTALLVEDNDELRGAIRETLEDMGYAVTDAADAESALGAAGGAAPAEGFDLLVSDVYMPGRSGIELADRLLAGASRLAVLLISSRGGEPEVRRRLAAGDVAFLAKPFSPEELAEKVAEAFVRVSERGAEKPPGTHARSRPGMPPRSRLLLGALVLVLGYALLRGFEPAAPALPPAPPPGGLTRSATVEIVRPLGPVAAAPSELDWRPVEGVHSYAVSVHTIDGTALWRGEAAAPPAAVSAEVEAALQRGVTYYWSVEAFDAEGALLARSELAPFVIAEPPE